MSSRDLRKPFIIGVGGGTGAGKSTLARRLAQVYGDLGTVILNQ